MEIHVVFHCLLRQRCFMDSIDGCRLEQCRSLDWRKAFFYMASSSRYRDLSIFGYFVSSFGNPADIPVIR